MSVKNVPRYDFGVFVPSMCNVVRLFFLRISLLDTTCFGLKMAIFRYTCYYAVHCNAVFFHPIVVASGYYFGYMVTISFIWLFLGCTWLLLVLFGLLVVAPLNVLARAGVLLCVVQPS
jgi:hypothetical protein